MGGYGSGQWQRTGTKRTAESVLALDVRRVFRSGGEEIGAGWVRCSVGQFELILSDDVVRIHTGKGKHAVTLAWTPCHYGGRRPWWVCPFCHYRAAVLYFVDDLAACRYCHGLAYTSQREDDFHRHRKKAQQLRRRLRDYSGGVFDPVPPRPRGMHRATYERLELELLAGQVATMEALQANFAVMDARLSRMFG
jgi:hypothetical protein